MLSTYMCVVYIHFARVADTRCVFYVGRSTAYADMTFEYRAHDLIRIPSIKSFQHIHGHTHAHSHMLAMHEPHSLTLACSSKHKHSHMQATLPVTYSLKMPE